MAKEYVEERSSGYYAASTRASLDSIVECLTMESPLRRFERDSKRLLLVKSTAHCVFSGQLICNRRVSDSPGTKSSLPFEVPRSRCARPCSGGFRLFTNGLAAEDGRNPASHDGNTIPAHFQSFVAAGNRGSGVIILPQRIPTDIAMKV